MPNTQQNNIQNETEQIHKNKKSLNQFQYGLMQIKKIQVKKKTKDGSFSNQKKYKI